MKETKDKKKKYPAAISMQVRLASMSLVPGESEKRTDGKEGWRVRATLFWFDETKTFLQNPKNLELIWAKDASDEYQRMREYVDREGNLATIKWLDASPGDQVKVKVYFIFL